MKSDSGSGCDSEEWNLVQRYSPVGDADLNVNFQNKSPFSAFFPCSAFSYFKLFNLNLKLLHWDVIFPFAFLLVPFAFSSYYLLTTDYCLLFF
jgi:hypothetical protein